MRLPGHTGPYLRSFVLIAKDKSVKLQNDSCCLLSCSLPALTAPDTNFSSHKAGDLSMRWARLVLYGLVAALATLTDVARADPCQNILEEFTVLSERANREVELSVANLREAVSDVRGDKRRIELIARSCAAAAEALGVFRSYRIVVSRCMGEEATGRSDSLFSLDRTISRLRVSLDKACR